MFPCSAQERTYALGLPFGSKLPPSWRTYIRIPVRGAAFAIPKCLCVCVSVCVWGGILIHLGGYFKNTKDSGKTIDFPLNCLKEFRWRTCPRKGAIITEKYSLIGTSVTGREEPGQALLFRLLSVSHVKDGPSPDELPSCPLSPKPHPFPTFSLAQGRI